MGTCEKYLSYSTPHNFENHWNLVELFKKSKACVLKCIFTEIKERLPKFIV